MITGNPYVEVRNGAYYVRGARVGLDVVLYDLRRGSSVDDVLRNFPELGSLDCVEGVAAFIRQHPEEVEAYLTAQKERFAELQRQYPIPPHLLDRFHGADTKADAAASSQ